MVESEKADVTIVSAKGQVVIPQAVRKKLGIKPKTKLLVYPYQDALIMKKLEIPDVRTELEAIYTKVDKRIAKYGEMSEEEINEIVQKYRHSKKQGD